LDDPRGRGARLFEIWSVARQPAQAGIGIGDGARERASCCARLCTEATSRVITAETVKKVKMAATLNGSSTRNEWIGGAK
jgi:hypothetical protein